VSIHYAVGRPSLSYSLKAVEDVGIIHRFLDFVLVFDGLLVDAETLILSRSLAHLSLHLYTTKKIYSTTNSTTNGINGTTNSTITTLAITSLTLIKNINISVTINDGRRRDVTNNVTNDTTGLAAPVALPSGNRGIRLA
jgi:hypothetical protein